MNSSYFAPDLLKVTTGDSPLDNTLLFSSKYFITLTNRSTHPQIHIDHNCNSQANESEKEIELDKGKHILMSKDR